MTAALCSDVAKNTCDLAGFRARLAREMAPWPEWGEYGKFKYEQAKKETESRQRQRQHQMQLKEVKFRPSRDVGDSQIKLRNALRFLQEGDKLKLRCVSEVEKSLTRTLAGRF